ncbi:MAG: magnesium chelatase, partial [Planctomycetota bacterium]|nr:magnesium chelatase [Planctomycetota bacterium]
LRVAHVVEEVAFRARESEFVDQASGVSVRLTVSLLENVVSNAERRALRNDTQVATARLADLFAAESAVTGKIELVFEGEREGPAAVADRVLGDGVLAVFQRHFPAPYQGKRKTTAAEAAPDAYKPIVDWFAAGNSVVVNDEGAAPAALRDVPGLVDLVQRHLPVDDRFLNAACELVLEGLHRSSLLAKVGSTNGVAYGDMLRDMFADFDG